MCCLHTCTCSNSNMCLSQRTSCKSPQPARVIVPLSRSPHVPFSDSGGDKKGKLSLNYRDVDSQGISITIGPLSLVKHGR